MRHNARLAILGICAVAALAIALAPAAFAQEQKMSKEEIEKLLDEKKVSVNFQDTPLQDALAFFSDLTGVLFDVHPAAQDAVDGARVTVAEKDITVRKALEKALAGSAGLRYEVQKGRVVIKLKK